MQWIERKNRDNLRKLEHKKGQKDRAGARGNEVGDCSVINIGNTET